MGASEEQLARFKNFRIEEKDKNIFGIRSIIEIQEIVAQINSEALSASRIANLLNKILSSNYVGYINISKKGNYPNYVCSLGRINAHNERLEDGDLILTVEGKKIIISIVRTKRGFFKKEKKYTSTIEEIDIWSSMKFSLIRSSAAYADHSGYTLKIK